MADVSTGLAVQKAGPPLVTVAMPVYNAGLFLRAAVMSIVRQTFDDWELLIIDDGSTDGAVDSIGDISDPRITMVRDGMNKGLAARLNEAIDRARGQYFARMDQDDVSHPERLARQITALEADAGVHLVGLRCIVISERGEIIGKLPSALSHEEICARPWLGFYLPHPTWLGRTEWFRRHRYAFPAPYFCEDQELLLRSHGESRFAVLPDYLFAYRVRDHINVRKSLRTRWAMCAVQARFFARSGRLAWMFLATAAMLARIGQDILGGLRQTMVRRSPTVPLTPAIPTAVYDEWIKILQAVSTCDE